MLFSHNPIEIANLIVIPHLTQSFLDNFKQAEKIIAKQPGYLVHQLIQQEAQKNHFLLIVQWETIAAHKEGFRNSEDYQEWKALLHHFYDPFPTVAYYEGV